MLDSTSIFGLLALLIAGTACAVALLVVRARAQLAVAQATPPTPPDSAELAELRTIRAEWETYRKHLEAYMEAFSDIEDQVEKKRRRVTSERQRAEDARAESAEPADPRAALRARARAAMPGLL